MKNYSNTDKMSAGAACGPGIYMAADASTSFGYMVAGQVKLFPLKSFLFGSLFYYYYSFS